MATEEPAQAGGEFDELQGLLGHRFRDVGLLETALSHASFTNETTGVASNERLEFLGDAVLGLVVADLLFQAKPAWQEGDLTRALQQLVDRTALAKLARRLDLGRWLRLGRTERQSGGDEKDSILSDATEAVVAALFLDAGYGAVVDFVRNVYSEAISAGAPRVERDPKTRFQETVVSLYGEFPRYELTYDTGLDGDDQRFSVAAWVKDEVWGTGIGRTKRSAERSAAEQALTRPECESVGE
jgi:ribonuclease-3